MGFRLTVKEKLPFELSLEGQAWLCREGGIWGKGIYNSWAIYIAKGWLENWKKVISAY